MSVIALLAVTMGVPEGRGQQAPSEYQLKAAFLFNFAKFVEWPASDFPNSHSEFSICILGTDPFGPAIDDILRGQMIGGRAVTVQRLREAAQLRRCQVAFISASEKSNLPQILEAVRGTNVLLVGETPGFAAAGGAIQFDMQDNRVRFSINPGAAERAGLRVSSKLLSLATIVRDASGNGKG